MRKKILICDDEALIRLLFFQTLKENYDIAEASDGAEALKKLVKEPFDLLITDLKMPKMNGIQVIHAIRKRRLTIPIIICSAYPVLKNEPVIKTSDVAIFLNKPIDIEQLKREVLNLIGT